MPNWKKIIVSGSNAALNSLSITSTLNVTGSTFLSASSGIALQLYGSGSTIFSISGSSSEIFRISDDGSSSNLFSVSSGSTTILSINSNKVVSISGSLVVTGSITGTLFGTASWATNALTASYVTGSVFTSTNPALSASYAVTASYALNGGGSATPGGANTQVQFNRLGAFSGSSAFTFNSASNQVTISEDGQLFITGSDLTPRIQISNFAQPGTTFIRMSALASSSMYLGYGWLGTNDVGLYTDGDAYIAAWDIADDSFHYSNNSYIYSGSKHIFTNVISASAGVTGSLFGTSSWARNALTASYGNITGSLFGTSSWATNALTASYISTLRATGSNTQIQFNNNGNLGSTSSFTFNSASNLVQIGTPSTGGNLSVYKVYNTVGYTALDTVNYVLNANNTQSIDWNNKILYSDNNKASVFWNSRYLVGNKYDINNDPDIRVDWQQGTLYDNVGIGTGPNSASINWTSRELYVNDGTTLAAEWGTDPPIWYGRANTASFVTSSNVYGPNGANSILTASFSLTASYVTGSIFTSTNPALSASYALTASYALNGGGSATPGGANTQIQFNRLGAFSGSANFIFNSASNAVKLTGSLEIADATNTFPVLSTSTWKLYDHFGTASLDWDVSTLYDQYSTASIEWNGRMLRDSIFTRSLDWDNRTLKNTNESDTVDWGNNYLYSNSTSNNLSLDWADRKAYGTNGVNGPDDSINWNLRILYDNAGAGSTVNTASIEWNDRRLKDTKNQTALKWSDVSTSDNVRLYGTASFALTSSIATSASYAVTASYVSSIKSGAVSTWGGTGTAPKTGSVTFTTPYANTNYAVTVTGGTGIARSWTIDTKTSTGFIINSNAKDVITGDVYWIAVPYNS